MDLPKEIQDLFPPVMLNALNALHTINQTPLEMSLPAILASVNLCTHALSDVDTRKWGSCPLSLFFCTVADSGFKKTTTSKATQEGITRFEKEHAKQAIIDYRAWQILDKKHDEDFKKAVIEGTTLPIKIPSPPTNRLIINKGTLNGLLQQLSETQHCGLLNADAATFFSSHAFQNSKNGADVELLATLSALYSAERVSTQTGIRENNMILDDRRFMMNTLIQESLAGFLNNPKYKEQGFVPRTLVSIVPAYKTAFVSFIDDDNTNKVNTAAEAALQTFNDRCYELLNKVGQSVVSSGLADIKQRLIAADAHKALDPKELNLPVMEQSADAIQAYNVFRKNDHEVLMELPEYKDHTAFMIRRYENAIRIAASCAIFNGDTEITLEMACLSIGIIEWFTKQRLSMNINTSVNNPIVDNATKVHKWMLQKQKDNGHKMISLTSRELGQYIPSVFDGMTAMERDTVLAEMIDRGYLDQITEGRKVLYTANEI